MKFTIEQPVLAAALSKVNGAVEKRNTIPILGNVLIYAAGNHIAVTGTDLDISVTTTAPATVSEPGSTTVSAAMLFDIVKKLNKGKLITFTADDRNATIKSGRSDIKLGVLTADDFPQIASAEYAASVEATQEDVKRLFDLSAFAMSTEETRYYLNGVYLHSVDRSLRAVSTDGHRLAQVDSEVRADIAGVIVPRKTVNLVKSLLTEGDATVRVSEAKVRFEFGDTVVTSKVIDGVFPDYTRVVPNSFKLSVTADATDLKRAGDLVSSVSNERTKAVKIALTEDLITLEVNGGIDNGREEVECQYAGDAFSVGVNSKYLAEVLQMCGDEAELSFNDSMSPMQVKTGGDDKVLWVLMPMRV